MQNSWGLKRDISPCFGARLVQEGCRLHFLADRAGISGAFNEGRRFVWSRHFR